jgi:hypothetical protein
MGAGSSSSSSWEVRSACSMASPSRLGRLLLLLPLLTLAPPRVLVLDRVLRCCPPGPGDSGGAMPLLLTRLMVELTWPVAAHSSCIAWECSPIGDRQESASSALCSEAPAPCCRAAAKGLCGIVRLHFAAARMALTASRALELLLLLSLSRCALLLPELPDLPSGCLDRGLLGPGSSLLPLPLPLLLHQVGLVICRGAMPRGSGGWQAGMRPCQSCVMHCECVRGQALVLCTVVS